MIEPRVISSQSVDDLLDALGSAPTKALPYLKELMTKTLFLLLDEVSPYPPATEANRPGRRNAAGKLISYYERGKGSWRPVKRVKTLNVHLAKINNKPGRSLGRGVIPVSNGEIAGYVLNPTSEQLGKNWNTSVFVFTSPPEVVGSLNNPTSYADYVQGFSQASFHRDRNWETVDQALELIDSKIDSVADQVLDKFIEAEF